MRSVLPGFSASDLYIASEDGAELYHFNSEGRHLSTLNMLTGAVRYQFAYDANGRLFTVTDGDNNITTINHDANGNPSAIVAPFGQTKTLTPDPNGYLATITDLAGGASNMVYTPDGLLQQFTDPNNNSSSIQYDPLGRLSLDTDPAGGFTKLTRMDTDRSYTASLTTALNRTTTYQVNKQTIAGECAGAAAAQYWADQYNMNSGLEAGLDAVMGCFASLWTPSTSDATLGVLAAGYGATGLVGSAGNLSEWASNPVMYEKGSKTIGNAAYAEYEGLSTIARGDAIVRDYGWLWAIFDLRGNWAATWGTGLTPGGSIFLLGGGTGLALSQDKDNGSCGCK